ncbi:helix-turn-helix domain-containing protein [Chryseobacterium indologenes]|uniref:helix-turn-helix domain-containing protein n=1 Tax=Chryseobacterium indologenes TaxID=253 RepID=UPI0016247BFF|nr:helix-turn-helix domain-containing protein [Chryseobacterium indologenes]
METVVLAPKDFIQQLKDSLIPELTANIKKDLGLKNDTEYLTREDVCSILKINKTTLWRWMKEKRIPSYGIGNRVYFIRSEVDQVILNNKI